MTENQTLTPNVVMIKALTDRATFNLKRYFALLITNRFAQRDDVEDWMKRTQCRMTLSSPTMSFLTILKLTGEIPDIEVTIDDQPWLGHEARTNVRFGCELLLTIEE